MPRKNNYASTDIFISNLYLIIISRDFLTLILSNTPLPPKIKRNQLIGITFILNKFAKQHINSIHLDYMLIKFQSMT